MHQVIKERMQLNLIIRLKSVKKIELITSAKKQMPVRCILEYNNNHNRANSSVWCLFLRLFYCFINKNTDDICFYLHHLRLKTTFLNYY